YGAFPDPVAETFLDAALRLLAEQVNLQLQCSDWAEKYGVEYENDVFMIHPFCWCERQDCPWCGGCECTSDSFRYFIDDREVTLEEWIEFYNKAKDKEEADRRRTRRHDPVCDFCLGKGIFSQHGSEPGKGAPNFWYKPTNLKVWWYKYIGRDMETNRNYTGIEVYQILMDCLRSIGAIS